MKMTKDQVIQVETIRTQYMIVEVCKHQLVQVVEVMRDLSLKVEVVLILVVIMAKIRLHLITVGQILWLQIRQRGH